MLTQARLDLRAHVLAATPDGNLFEFTPLLDKIFSAGIIGMGKTVAFSRQMLVEDPAFGGDAGYQ